MLTIVKLAEKFRNIDTEKIIHESLVETTGDFEDHQRSQLMHGKTKTGDNIKPSYKSAKYAMAKHDMNPLPGLGTPDLKLTGDFQSWLDVEVGRNEFDIISKDEKGPELEHKYKNIFGLGGRFKSDYLKENLQPAIKNKIANFTGLKFR